eukprot:355888-Chlamydomonas_euryale.AAC.2
MSDGKCGSSAAAPAASASSAAACSAACCTLPGWSGPSSPVSTLTEPGSVAGAAAPSLPAARPAAALTSGSGSRAALATALPKSLSRPASDSRDPACLCGCVDVWMWGHEPQGVHE